MSFLNNLKDKIKQAASIVLVDNEVQQQRIEICNSCPDLNQTIRQCRICFCLVDGKTKLAGSACPKNKWRSVNTTNIDTK
jgi:ABC-type cobalamin transport system ATPase subunit